MMRTIVDLINNSLLRAADARIVRKSQLYPWQHADALIAAEVNAEPLPADTLADMNANNPRLVELRSIYAEFDPAVSSPLVWTDDIVTQQDFQRFRGDNAFLYQLRGLQYNELSYALTTYYTMSAPEGAILARLSEDGAFGAHVLEVAERLVSRDLLDSAREIDFLTRHVQPAAGPLRVLDIGAGYGRLPHRLSEALGDAVKVYATDGFPFSTFISELYLRHRQSAAQVVPLHQFEAFIAETPIDVAVNIHSFSECRTSAIDWWVSRLARHEVRHLMIIPNGEFKDALTPCLTNDGWDMEVIFERHGYRCATREFRYADPIVRRYGIDPAQLSLFSLK
jgi:hypothetical protein